jgi:hypothetical protein
MYRFSRQPAYHEQSRPQNNRAGCFGGHCYRSWCDICQRVWRRSGDCLLPRRRTPVGTGGSPVKPGAPDRSLGCSPVQRAALVDKIYDDLMRSFGCMLASSSIGGECRN